MGQKKWTIRYETNVIKNDIPLLSHTIKQRIQKAIETKLISNPVYFGKPLRYSLNHLRSFRVGDYRILYGIDHDQYIISIYSIGHRRDIYEE
jgi:mRNA interferase RelE/StbE